MAEMNETPPPAGEIPKPPEPPVSGPAAGQSAGAEQPQANKETNRDACMWAMFCHLAGLAGFLPLAPILGGIIAPLIVWQIKKDQFTFADEQGKESVNFQISILIYAALLCLTCIGVVLLPAVYVFDVVFLLIAGVKANNGEHYRYPLSIRFIK